MVGGMRKEKNNNIETHESKVTGEGESAQRNVVKMRSREKIFELDVRYVWRR